MRNVGLVLPTLAVLSGLAASTPNILAPLYQPLLHGFFGVSNNTSLELRRRQYDPNACPSGYGVNCAGLGNAALCCPDDAVCSADFAGNVACCPVGAACTGSVTSTTATATATTTTTSDNVIGGVAGSTSTTSTQSFIFASSVTTTTSSSASTTTTAAAGGGGVIINPDGGSAGGTGAASGSLATVSNPYFPIAIVPSTYASADACSRAYSTCQADIAGCSSALAGLGAVAGGGGGGGITISAPNGGTTILPVTTSFASAEASSICASLSTRACGTFSVQQCSIFGSGGGGGDGQASPTSQGGAAGRAVGRGDAVVHMIFVAVVLMAA